MTYPEDDASKLEKLLFCFWKHSIMTDRFELQMHSEDYEEHHKAEQLATWHSNAKYDYMKAILANFEEKESDAGESAWSAALAGREYQAEKVRRDT